ncbi:MAG: multiprotein-bridging factor 1 family protein [Halobacteriaceae archaeon]
MAKYSTGGGSGGGESQTCELCGKADDDLRTASVAGATLQVCPDCAPHDDQQSRRDRSDEGDERSRQERDRRAAQNTAKAIDASRTDSSWVESGTSYDDDPLPYLVHDYGERVVRARQEAGLQREELAAELGVEENDLLAVEQGRATQASVGGSVVAAIEDRLDLELVDE